MRNRLLALGLAAIFSLATAAMPDEQKTLTVDVALVTTTANDDVNAGIQRGLTEASLLGRFTGQEYRLQEMDLEQIAESDGAIPTAIVAALKAEDLQHLSSIVSDIPIFNISAAEDELRSLCRPNLFHIGASQRMLKDAVAQWQKKHPGAAVEARTWHHEFVKYAARDLNKRFTKSQGRPMNDQSWAAWTAVKVIADAVTRTGDTTPQTLLTFLRDGLEFDGNKGVILNFRGTGQLRQPLLIIENENLVGEAPVRGVADIEDLDSLGMTQCPAN